MVGRNGIGLTPCLAKAGRDDGPLHGERGGSACMFVVTEKRGQSGPIHARAYGDGNSPDVTAGPFSES